MHLLLLNTAEIFLRCILPLRGRLRFCSLYKRKTQHCKSIVTIAMPQYTTLGPLTFSLQFTNTLLRQHNKTAPNSQKNLNPQNCAQWFLGLNTILGCTQYAYSKLLAILISVRFHFPKQHNAQQQKNTTIAHCCITLPQPHKENLKHQTVRNDFGFRYKHWECG